MKKLIRITTISSSLNILLENQLNFMNQYYEVEAISSDEEGLKKVSDLQGVKVHCIEMTRKISLLFDLIALWKLYRYFKKEKPFIVHTHTPKAGTLGMIAAKLAGVPHRLHTVAGLPLLEAKGVKRIILNIVEKITYSCATFIYPNSNGLKNIIIQEHFCQTEKLKVLENGSSNGIDTSYFNPVLISDEQKQILRLNLGITKEDFVFIFVGRIVGDKGINELVNAFEIFNKENKSGGNAKLLLVGAFEKKLDSLKPTTFQLFDSNKNIITVGYQNDVRSYFAISDCLVFPSYREGFPNVVLQAGAMGLPCIVSNINGCNEIITNGENGIIIPIKDEKSIGLAMQKMITDDSFRNHLRQNARKRIVGRFEQSTMWEAILAEYKNLEASPLLESNKKELINTNSIFPKTHDVLNKGVFNNSYTGESINELESGIIKKKLCYIVSTTVTSKAFLENNFEVMSRKYDLYLVANLNNNYYFNNYLKEIKHIPIHRKISYFNDILSIILLTKYLKINKFDIVISFTPKAGLIGITSSKLAGIKKRVYFFTGQVWHTKTGFIRYLLKLIDKLVVYLSTNIVVDGRSQQEFLIENNIISINNSTVFGNGTITGIDLIKFTPNLDIRKEIRESLGYNEKDVVFMYLGRLNADKGLLDLAKAFNKLQELYSNVKLLIVGPDEDNFSEKLKSELNNMNYFLYGPTKFPEKVLQASDVFCLPSHREAFGLSVIEASACGKPILCSDTYGLKYTIIEGETGLSHITHSFNSIFEKMKILTEDLSLRNTLGANGRNYVKKYFSKERLTNIWVDYFDELHKK